MMSISIRLSFTGAQVDCTTNTCCRGQSHRWRRSSPRRRTRLPPALPSSRPISRQMASARGRLELPEKILMSLPCEIMFYILSIFFSFYFCRAHARTFTSSLTGASYSRFCSPIVNSDVGAAIHMFLPRQTSAPLPSRLPASGCSALAAFRSPLLLTTCILLAMARESSGTSSVMVLPAAV